MKVCTDCGKDLPLTEYSERPNYNGTETLYHKSHCKYCDVLRTRAWVKNNRKQHLDYQKAYQARAREVRARASKK